MTQEKEFILSATLQMAPSVVFFQFLTDLRPLMQMKFQRDSCGSVYGRLYVHIRDVKMVLTYIYNLRTSKKFLWFCPGSGVVLDCIDS